MVFDFAAQPPEVISTKIYSGPGAEPLQAAATAWEGLAGELQSTASSYQSVISELTTGSWEGPSAAAAAAAAAPYVTWLSTTAAQADQAASQARAAAGAYEAAFAATVPPAEIAANRSQLASLLQTNLFGQNTSAIAATEAQYGEFWAQDVTAMFGYASSSAAASRLTPFTGAPTTTNSSGQANQSAAVAAASTTTSTSNAATIIEQVETDFGTGLKDVTGVSTDYNDFWNDMLAAIPGGWGTKIEPVWANFESLTSNLGSNAAFASSADSTTGLGISQWKNFYIYQPWSQGTALGALNGGLSSPGHAAVGLGGGARAASAVMGSAQTVGKLSVPPSWAGATPAIRLAATALPDSTFAVTAAPATGIPLGLLNQSAMGSFTGGALGSPVTRVVSSTGVQARVIAPERTKGPVKLDKVIARLQEQPDQVQHWNVDEAGLDDLLARLSTKPGIHAVHLSADDKTPAATAKPATDTG